MGILSSLLLFGAGRKAPMATCPREAYAGLVIELAEFRCGHTVLGAPISRDDFFAKELATQDMFQDEACGFEVGTRQNNLEYIYLAVEKFPGTFTFQGETIAIGTQTTIEEIVSRFGEPYWRDVDKANDEIILFYENGTAEIQFEFPGMKRLGIITVMTDPLMADSEQRKAYGVTKPWPPPR